MQVVKAGRPRSHCVPGLSKNCHNRPLPGNASSSSLPSSLPVSFAQAVSPNNNRSAEVGVSSSCLPQNISTEDQLRSPCHNEERRTSEVVDRQAGRAEPIRPNSVTSAVVDSPSATLPPQSTLSSSEGKVFGENTCLHRRHFSGSWSLKSNSPGDTLDTVAMSTRCIGSTTKNSTCSD